MSSSIGELFKKGQLIAKTVDRLVVEPDNIDLQPWKIEAKLLTSPAGNCLSSGTILSKGTAIPTYGVNGRCYGVLYDAAQCDVYDFYKTDANSTREAKLAARRAYKYRMQQDPQAQAYYAERYQTLLAEITAEEATTQLNEVFFDAWEPSCVGLFVRYIDLENAQPAALKNYYSSLFEIMLIQKLFSQGFGIDLKIYQYDEVGKLMGFPTFDAALFHARITGVSPKNYPALFGKLDKNFNFPDMTPRATLGSVLLARHYEIRLFKEAILVKLLREYTPFHGDALTTTTILNELVDFHIGISQDLVDEVIQACKVQLSQQLSSSIFFQPVDAAESSHQHATAGSFVTEVNHDEDAAYTNGDEVPPPSSSGMGYSFSTE